MTLLEEILSKCSAEVLAGRDPQTIADAVNVGRFKFGQMPQGKFGMWCAENGMLSKIKDHSVDKTSPIRDAALGCDAVVNGALPYIDFSLDGSRQMLGAFVAYGGLEQDQADELLSLVTLPDSITEFDVRCALWAADGTWLGG